MQTITIKSVCTQCSGTGTFASASGPSAGGQISCTWPGCGGTGYVEMGKIELDPGLDDLMDKLNDVLEKCNDILEGV